jgi:hypothetical protein
MNTSAMNVGINVFMWTYAVVSPGHMTCNAIAEQYEDDTQTSEMGPDF